MLMKKKLIDVIKQSEEIFYKTLGEWDTEPAELELNPDSKPFNCKH